MELLQDDLMPAKSAPLTTNASECRPYLALQALTDLMPHFICMHDTAMPWPSVSVATRISLLCALQNSSLCCKTSLVLETSRAAHHELAGIALNCGPLK